jgi:hypothetical protein
MGATQVIYAVLALGVLGFLTLIMGRSQQAVYYEMYQNEFLTQFTGVATEILEDIGSHPFDYYTEDGQGWNADNPPQITGITQDGGAEWGNACTVFVNCDIDDFDNAGVGTFQRDRNGVTFDVTTEVRYVDENDPTLAAPSDNGGRTWMKEVTLTITSPDIYKKNNPDSLIEMQMSRVFSYFKTQTGP